MTQCSNCHTTMHGKFCSSCGQKEFNIEDHTIKKFFSGAFKDFTHFDFKIFKDLPALMFRPGYLTSEYLAGRINKHIKPVTLFIWLNVFFFLGGYKSFLPQNKYYAADTYISGLQEKIIAKGAIYQMSPEDTIQHYNDLIIKNQKYIFFFIIPLFALLLFFLFLNRKDNYYIKQFIFSIHFWCYFYIYMTLILLATFLINVLSTLISDERIISTIDGLPILIIMILGIIPYIFIALRKVFKESILMTSLKSVLVFVGLILLRNVAIKLTFYMAYYSM